MMNLCRWNLLRCPLWAIFCIAFWATSAQAAHIYFDFAGDAGAQDRITFESDGLSVTASGFNTKERRQVHQSSRGLGVTADADSNNQIDGNPYPETLRLVFSEAIHVHSIRFELMTGRGDDFSLTLDGRLVADDVDPGDGWWVLPERFAEIAASQVDLIADHENDDFRVGGIHVNTWDTAVHTPEPSAALVFGLGGLLVARTLRRRGRA